MEKQNSFQLMKYHGRISVVPLSDNDFQFVIQKLINLTVDLQQTEMCRNDNEWKQFFEDLTAFTNHMVNPQSQIHRYQLEIICDCLLPYITKLKARFYTDKERVRQLSLIMYALSIKDSTMHPAICLSYLEGIKEEIQGRQSYFWKSELLGILDSALEKQWRPILLDLRFFLHDLARKLCTGFLFTVIGWPLAFVFPVYGNATRLLRILKEWESHRQVSNQSIFELLNVGIMIIGFLHIMSIVAVYRSIGIICPLLPSATMFLSLNDRLLKQFAPTLTIYAISYDKFINKVGQLNYLGMLQSIQDMGFKYWDSKRHALNDSASGPPITEAIELTAATGISDMGSSSPIQVGEKFLCSSKDDLMIINTEEDQEWISNTIAANELRRRKR